MRQVLASWQVSNGYDRHSRVLRGYVPGPFQIFAAPDPARPGVATDTAARPAAQHHEAEQQNKLAVLLTVLFH